MLDFGFLFTGISPHRSDFSLIGFQKDPCNIIERLKIECRKTKTKVITLANHSKRKQRQLDHGENTFEPVTNLNSQLNLQGLISN